MSATENADSLFEAMFRQAVVDNFEEELAAIPSKSEIRKQYSSLVELDIKMAKLFARERIKVRLRVFAKVAERVAACFLIAVLLAGAVIATVPQARAAFMRVVIEWTEKYTKFTAEGDGIHTAMPQWTLGYLPDGYVEIERLETEQLLEIYYQNDAGGFLAFGAMSQSGSLLVNNEGVQYHQQVIEGVVYHLFEAETIDNFSQVVWDAHGYRFNVNGSLSVDELLTIAESVIKNN